MSLPSTLPYHLMEQIKALIIDNTYRPGEPLREQELERRFSSSRSPIREALRLLELKGLVIHLPRKGFRVRRMTQKEISDLYHLRAELEGYTIQLLEDCPRIDALIGELEAVNEAMARAFQQGSARDYLDQNTAFHSAILSFSQNKPLEFSLDQINQIAQPLRFNVLNRELSSSTSLDYHRRITGDLAGGRFAEARAMMKEHVLVSLPGVLKHYDGLADEAET